MFARKGGQYWTPDDYLYLALNSGNTKILSVETDDKGIYDEVLGHLQEKKKTERPLFSFLQNNCTTFAAGVLDDTLGIHLNTKLSFFSYICRRILPPSTIDKLVSFHHKTIGKLPSVVQKALFFSPLVYVPTVLLGLFCQLLMLKNRKGYKGTDFTILDVFFRPWMLYVDHPCALREDMDTKFPSGRIALSRDSQKNWCIKHLPRV